MLLSIILVLQTRVVRNIRVLIYDYVIPTYTLQGEKSQQQLRRYGIFSSKTSQLATLQQLRR